MSMHAKKAVLSLPASLLCGALALSAILATGCGESGKPSPVPAKVESAATKTADTMKKVAEPVVDATKKAADATADAAKKAVDATKKAGEDATAQAKAAMAAQEAASKKMADAAKQSAETMQDAAAKGVEAAKLSNAQKAAELQKNLDAQKMAEAQKNAEAQKSGDDAAMKAREEKQRQIALEAQKNGLLDEREIKRRQSELMGQGLEETAAHDKAVLEAKEKLSSTRPVDPLAQDTDPNSKARLTYEFGSDTHNFGKVMQGDVLNHKFKMQSSGEEDLVIKQAKPTCGCTVADIMVEEGGSLVPYQYGKPIAPGKKIEISATLHTQNKRGHAGSKVNITTNDPRGQTILSLEAEVDPFFQVNPPSINFNQLAAKDTATDKISVTTTKGDKVKLVAIKDNMPQGLKIDVNTLDPDAEGKGTRFEVVVTAGPGLVEGNLAYSVPLRSDAPIPGGEKMPNGQMPTYEVAATIMARVTGAISFNPQFVSLGLIRPGQTLSRSVRITSHDASFKLTDPKVSIQGRDSVEWEFAKFFTPVVRPVQGENSVDVEVTLVGMPESLSGSFSGTLVINVGHPEKPEIKLPITGVCRGGAAGGTPTPAPVPVPVPAPAGGTPK